MPLFNSPSNDIPLASSSAGAAAGVAGTFARADHVHPRGTWDASDNNLLYWSHDIAIAASGNAPIAAGTVCVVKIKIPVTTMVTNLHMYISVAGASLTSGQNFAALYTSAKQLLAQTSDQSTAWASAGFKSMSLSAPQTIPAGTYYVAFWANGTTLPAFRTGFNSASVNGGLSGELSRFASADTGITTTAPATLASLTAQGFSWWVAVS